MSYISDKLASASINNFLKGALNYLLVKFSLLSVSNDIKHIVVFFFCLIGITEWCHPNNGDTRGGPPPSDALGSELD